MTPGAQQVEQCIADQKVAGLIVLVGHRARRPLAGW